MIKKILLGLLALVVLIFAAAFTIPFLYKDEIKGRIDKELAKSVDATIYFSTDDFSLSLFKHFPNLTVSMGNFGVVGKGDFKGDTLAAIKDFSVTVDIMSVISGNQIKVNAIDLKEPYINVIVLKNGKANYDIAIADTTVKAAEPGEPSSFNVAIKKWSITNGRVIYNDGQTPMLAIISGLNHEGSGDFTQDVFDLDTKTTVDALTYELDSTQYLSNKRLEANVVLEMNNKESKYTFKNNQFRLNDFAFGFNGSVALAGDDINTDITFEAQETSFKNILSLVPGVFTKDFADIKTDGTLAFNGYAKGTYNTTSMPTFGLNLKVDKGMLQYPKVPSAITNINLDLAVENKTPVLDNTVINVKNFHMDLGKNPVDAKALVKGLTNYDIDANVKAKIDLAEITQAVPMEGLTLKGLFGLDVTAKGVYSEANHSMPAVTANLNMIDGYVKSSAFPAPIEQINMAANVANATGKMADTKADIKNFNMLLEGERFTASGHVENLDDYTWNIKAKGGIDLSKITKIYPIEGMTLTGKILADIATSGKMSDVDAGRYDKLPTSGTMQVSNFTYNSKDFPQGIKVTEASLAFDPRKMDLKSFSGFAGSSDIKLQGSISNYLPYVLKNETINGNLSFTSTKLNVNEFMPAETTATTQPETSEPMAAVEVPKNINFTFNANVGTILYDNMSLSNATGKVIVSNGVVNLDHVAFNTLGGSMNVTGKYDPTTITAPKFAAAMSIKDMNVQQAYKTFNTVQKLAPVAEKISGSFSTDFNMNGLLDKTMSPVFPTLNGGGIVTLKGASISNLSIVSGINKLTKLNAPSSYSLDDIKLSATIVNGRAVFKPFDIKAGNQKINIGGSQGFDGTIDYAVKMAVPAGSAGAAFNSAVSSLTGGGVNTSQNINLNIGVTGTQTNPKYKLLSAGGSSAKDAAKDLAKQKLDEARAKANQQLEDAKAKARAEADKAKAEAEAKARAEADRLKKEAEDKAKQQVDKLKGKFKLPGK